MKKGVPEVLLNEAEKLISYSDKEILALSLSKNDKWGENYAMAMNIRLKGALNSLNSNIKSLRKFISISS